MLAQVFLGWGARFASVSGALLVLLSLPLSAHPQAPESDLSKMNIEELMNVEVTSASKKAESLSQAPAAIFVITAEDIRHSGLSSLPELLRMVPGMTVQQVNAHSWTVSTRGFTGFPNEKMLVLIDGRAVYDPLYGGVNWDVQDVRLEDVERIEVIRGPGGTLWGANAVNGVINVITKKAQQTQGVSLSTSLGSGEGYQGSARYGSSIGDHFFYRIFAKSSFWDPFVDATGAELFNGWNLSQIGMRSDWQVTGKDTLSLDAAGYHGNIHDTAQVSTLTANQTVEDPYEVMGGHILGRWGHTFSGRSSTDLLAYCDWTNRTDVEYAGEYRDTCDFELQHNFKISTRHSLIWGGDFRTTADQTRVTFRNHFTPPDERINLFSVFGQYELQVVPDKLRVIGGSKFEYNTFTGFEIQPQIRAVWTLAKAHSLWSAVSRSVRTPTRNEEGNFLILQTVPLGPPPTPPIVTAIVGNPNLTAEHQIAYEIGYRYQPTPRLSFDIAAFYNSYTDLLYPDFGRTTTSFSSNPAYVLNAFPFSNLQKAQTHGLEVSAKWRPIQAWLLSLGITEDRGTDTSMTSTPRHQFNVQSQVDLHHGFAFDPALYHSNAISETTQDGTPVNLPTSNRVDLGLTWRSKSGLSMGVWGRNLQSDRHQESQSPFLANGEVRRAVVVKLGWDFEHH